MIHIATTARRGWFLVIDRFQGRSGKFRVVSFLAKEPNYPDPEDIGDECGNFGFLSAGAPCRTRPEVDLDANVVRASVARSCLGNPTLGPCRCRRVRLDRLRGRDVRQLLR